MSRHLLILSIALLLIAPVNSAGADALGEREIKSVIAGQTVLLSTGYGFSLPLHYGRDGNVTGDGTGTMLGRFFAPKETGRWWVENDRLCQQWPSWYEGRTFCFTVRKTGSRTIEWRRDDGYSGTARISG